MTSIFEINDAFNNYLTRKAKREGKIHNKYLKLIDDDLLEWSVRAKTGLLTEAEKPAKLPVTEESLPISEKTGKRKLAVWCPFDRKVLGYVSESDEEPFTTLARALAQQEEAKETKEEGLEPLSPGRSSDSECSQRLSCATESSEPKTSPHDLESE